MKLLGVEIGPGLKVLSVDRVDSWLDDADTGGRGEAAVAPARGEDPAMIMYTSRHDRGQ